MTPYKVYADAAADVPRELRSRYQIEVLPIAVALGEKTFQSGLDLENEDFYGMLEAFDGIPVTSQVTPYAFEELFEKEFSEGTRELLIFLINAKGSATYNNAIATRERFFADHPQAKEQMRIHLFDGASYSFGYGYPAVLAAQKLEMGMNTDEVVELANEQLRKQRIFFGLYSLKYAGKSGRIPSAAVFVGEALGIKPIMQVWDHAITTVGKARGDKKLIKEIVKMTLDDMEPNTPYSIGYGSDPSVMEELTAEMTKKVGYPPVYTFRIGPAIAINAGPKVVGVVFEVNQKKLAKEDKKKNC